MFGDARLWNKIAVQLHQAVIQLAASPVQRLIFGIGRVERCDARRLIIFENHFALSRVMPPTSTKNKNSNKRQKQKKTMKETKHYPFHSIDFKYETKYIKGMIRTDVRIIPAI